MTQRLFRKHGKVAGLLLAIIVLVVLPYGYRCISQKVCGVTLLNQIARDGVLISTPNGEPIEAEVADTQEARELGLSGRTGLGESEGLLFVFDHPGKYGFWMKDMLFPIDMVWINENGVAVHIEREISPDTYFDYDPPKTFVNTPDATYVLELASGSAEKHGIYLGTKVKIGE